MAASDPRVGDQVFYLISVVEGVSGRFTLSDPAAAFPVRTEGRPAIVVALGEESVDLQVFTGGPPDGARSVEFTSEELHRGLAFRPGVYRGLLAGTWCPILEDLGALADPAEQLLHVPAIIEMVCETASPGSRGGDVELRADRGADQQAIDGYARLAVQDPAVFRYFFTGGRYRVTIEPLDVLPVQTADTTGEAGDLAPA